jgi:putative transposase
MKFGGSCEKNGRSEEPTAGIVDSQSVKGTVESAEASGFDGGKKVKGRKHHRVIDTTGCVLVATVHAANVHDSRGVRPLFERLFETVPTVPWIGADQAYEGDWVAWMKTAFSCTLDIVYKTAKEFKVLPRRWVVERTFAWLSRYRSLVREYEKRPASSTAMIYAAPIRIMLKKLYPQAAITVFV